MRRVTGPDGADVGLGPRIVEESIMYVVLGVVYVLPDWEI